MALLFRGEEGTEFGGNSQLGMIGFKYSF